VWNGASLSGGFHTVDIPKRGGKDLPLILPTGKLVSGVLDAGGNPFWFNGKVPELGFNPALGLASGGHVYNGSARIDSGLPTSPKPHNFKVKFTKAGKYRYFCDVHPNMSGWVIVRAAGKPVPSAKADAAELLREEKHYAKEAKRVAKAKPPKNTVDLGASGPGGVEVFAMFPASLSVSAGTTVHFVMAKGTREVHTASFGPADYLKTLSDSFLAPIPSPAALYASDAAHIVLTPTSHGNGFANTGAMDRDSGTPLPGSNTITFTQPGTYTFECLIHTFMHGTIVVK
jgi:plastocyanin